MSSIIHEILAGDHFATARYYFGIEAELVYCGKDYEVWWISDSGLQKLCNIPDDEWTDEFGWWRYAEGCNITDWPTKEFTINGKSMIGWYRESDELFDSYYKPTEYSCLTDYLCNAIGASSPKNICAISVGLADLNDMTMAKLFEEYQGYQKEEQPNENDKL